MLRPIVRGLLVLVTAALAALALSGQALAAGPHPRLSFRASGTALPAAAAKKRTPQVLFRNLKGCGAEAYNSLGYQCARDERSRGIVSKGAICTVTVYAFSAVTVRMKMTYGGSTLFSKTSRYRARTRVSLAFGVTFPIVLPAGGYKCTFTAGKKKTSATIPSRGTTGSIVETAVCQTANARPNNAGCASDESVVPQSPTSSLTCSGWFVKQQGHRGGIELLYNDAGTWTSVFAGDLAIPVSLYSVTATVPNMLGNPFAPGEYMCRYSVDGTPIAEKHFTVHA
jgi:hypothetical protein